MCRGNIVLKEAHSFCCRLKFGPWHLYLRQLIYRQKPPFPLSYSFFSLHRRFLIAFTRQQRWGKGGHDWGKTWHSSFFIVPCSWTFLLWTWQPSEVQLENITITFGRLINLKYSQMGLSQQSLGGPQLYCTLPKPRPLCFWRSVYCMPSRVQRF